MHLWQWKVMHWRLTLKLTLWHMPSTPIQTGLGFAAQQFYCICGHLPIVYCTASRKEKKKKKKKKKKKSRGVLNVLLALLVPKYSTVHPISLHNEQIFYNWESLLVLYDTDGFWIGINPFVPNGLFYFSIWIGSSNIRGVRLVFIITMFYRNCWILMQTM